VEFEIWKIRDLDRHGVGGESLGSRVPTEYGAVAWHVDVGDPAVILSEAGILH
jgi:hypothetical protein